MVGRFQLWVTTVYLLVLLVGVAGYSEQTFKAAVYEHAPLPPNRTIVVSRRAALEYMRGNLQVYRSVAEEAQRQTVDIIVFPEDGITFRGHTRKSIRPYLEVIPDPKHEVWNPCLEPNRYPQTEVQQWLSCLARNNSLYVVANMGDYQTCGADDNNCPSDGHYQFNTDVVYDSNGTLIAKYHKINLFYEFMFDPSPSKEAVSFETPFGTFGMFTCFDILFRNPVVVLMKERGVSNIAFPTAWMDTAPFLAAIQFHSAVAAGFGVNFLAANLHDPEYRFQGSGIYSPEGAKTYYYNNTIQGQENGGKLLIADLRILKKNSLATHHDDNGLATHNSHNLSDTDMSRYSEVSSSGKVVFHAETFGDIFNYVPLTKSGGEVRVCHNRLCCTASYSPRDNFTELFALGAFDGLHTKEGTYYIQVCGIVRCKTQEKSSCGEGSRVSNTYFTKLALSGTFTTPYVFPEILLYGEEILNLAPSNKWSYSKGHLEASSGLEKPVLSFSLFARDYDYDLLMASSSSDPTVSICAYCCLLMLLNIFV